MVFKILDIVQSWQHQFDIQSEDILLRSATDRISAKNLIAGRAIGRNDLMNTIPTLIEITVQSTVNQILFIFPVIVETKAPFLLL